MADDSKLSPSTAPAEIAPKCEVCGRVLPMNEEFCSTECMDEFLGLSTDDDE